MQRLVIGFLALGTLTACGGGVYGAASQPSHAPSAARQPR
jgi:hypothetical protein